MQSGQRSDSGRLIRLPALWAIVLVQAAIHLAILPFGGVIGDTAMLGKWAVTLTSHPLADFYARQPKADHLPGDLWMLKLEAGVYRLVSGHAPSNPGFLNALKLGPGLADIGLAVTLYLIARDIGGRQAGRRAALLFALNPAPIFIAMVWAIADSVSMLVAVIAILLAIKRRFWAAAPALAYACLIKPQLAALAPLLLIYAAHEWWGDPRPRRLARAAIEALAAASASIAVVLVVILPFNVGVPGFDRRWSLAGRLTFAANLYDQTTMNALNLWAWSTASFTNFPTAYGTSDQLSGPLGLSYQAWGTAMSAVACLVLAIPLLRKGGKERLVFTCAAALFAIFMLQTRIHERYFFPAVALMAVIVALRPNWIWLYLPMSAVYFFNVLAVYIWISPSHAERGPKSAHGTPPRLPGHVTPTETRLLVAANLLVLAAFVLRALLDLRERRSERIAETAEPAVAAPLSPFNAWPQP